MGGVKRRGLLLLVGLMLALPCLFWWRHWRLEHSQDGPILAAARRYGMDPTLVKAVVWRESGFNPRALGRAGEIGLMQLMDAAAQEWAETEHAYPLPEEHLFHPATNTLAGTWYLRKLLRRYARCDNAVPFALAEYNAGRGNVLKWAQGSAATNSAAFLERIGFPGTRAYVGAILARRGRYRGDFPPRTATNQP
jgi:soluble lytic murein transglycosylase